MPNWRERLSTDPNVCHGQVCVRGTRVPVAVVLANLADGESIDDIVRQYPIQRDDVLASLEYAVELAQERIVVASTDS